VEFINSIDARYFEHIAALHSQALEGDEKQYAATALRIAYSQGLETLFALLCAIVQAPDCIVGWLLKYQNRDLVAVVRKICERESFYTKWQVSRVTWEVLADIVFSNVNTGDDEKHARIRKNFARLWGRFASYFLDKKHEFEYNSIKHGLRAKMGGFYFAMGEEDVPGEPAPPERMRLIANSEFGSSFFIPQRLHDGRNFSISHQALNWHPQSIIYALLLISMSINNVIGFLKILYGAAPNEIQFSWPDNESTYQEPWSRETSISSLEWHSQVAEETITPLTKEEILAVYSEGEKDNSDTNKRGE
jgi:hypothetical protein